MTMTLPTHLGGYQHLARDVTPTSTDILVLRGNPVAFVGDCLAFDTVEQLEDHYGGCNVYRLIPVAKQSDSHERDIAAGYRARAAVHRDAREGLTRDMAAIAQRPTTPAVTPELPKPVALPTEAQARKRTPIYSGFLKYFPRACAEVARVSQAGNDQHNPGKPLHWDRSKSGDELDALSRHLLEAGTFDTDGRRHSAKLAWRSMANLEKELEAAERGCP